MAGWGPLRRWPRTRHAEWLFLIGVSSLINASSSGIVVVLAAFPRRYPSNLLGEPRFLQANTFLASNIMACRRLFLRKTMPTNSLLGVFPSRLPPMIL